jgi:DNA-directed RNA polymerase subunit RPC12/RpoP
MTTYTCAMCGKKVFNRSICTSCEKTLHHHLRKASKTPHGVRRYPSLPPGIRSMEKSH